MKDQNNFPEWLEKILSQSLFSPGGSKLTVGLILTLAVSFEIFKCFAGEAIELPSPQRDLPLKSGFEKLIK